MATIASITAPIDPTTLAMVNTLANARGIAAEEFAAEAIRRVAESEADFRAFLQAGVDAADRGELVPHEQVMAELDEMVAKHRSK